MEGKKQSRRVVIVDEDPYWQDFSKKVLESKGFKVETSPHLADLPALLDSQPDIVILGFAAIDHTELEVINAFLDQSNHRHVLVFSTSLPLQTVRLLFRLGAADVTGKPFAPEELVELVEEELGEEEITSSYQEVKQGGHSDG